MNFHRCRYKENRLILLALYKHCTSVKSACSNQFDMALRFALGSCIYTLQNSRAVPAALGYMGRIRKLCLIGKELLEFPNREFYKLRSGHDTNQAQLPSYGTHLPVPDARRTFRFPQSWVLQRCAPIRTQIKHFSRYMRYAKLHNPCCHSIPLIFGTILAVNLYTSHPI